MNTNEREWRKPPPGTALVTEGFVQQGDWFYIERLGAWAPVPKIGWGEPVGTRLIARGAVDVGVIDWRGIPHVPGGSPR